MQGVMLWISTVTNCRLTNHAKEITWKTKEELRMYKNSVVNQFTMINDHDELAFLCFDAQCLCTSNSTKQGHGQEIEIKICCGVLDKTLYINIFLGAQCETFKCPCSKNGRCVRSSPTSQYRCICQSGYSGLQCEQFIGDCRTVEQKKCVLDSFCQNTTTGYGYVCVCRSHLSGEKCNRPGSCDYSPCLNNGSCVSLDKGQYCILYFIKFDVIVLFFILQNRRYRI